MFIKVLTHNGYAVIAVDHILFVKDKAAAGASIFVGSAQEVYDIPTMDTAQGIYDAIQEAFDAMSTGRMVKS